VSSCSIAGHISTVQVKQQFANPFDTKIEAVYVFPLPKKAAVTEFLMVIGERTIRGILREKEEAEAIYRAARDQGYQASLLVQHRPNVFEQKVANIGPGKAIDVDITYFHALAYKDGWYSFVFPTVVGSRFNRQPVPATEENLAAAGRFRGEPVQISVSGTVDGARRTFVVQAAEAGSAGPSLAKVWARANIAELTDRQATVGDPHGELRDDIRRIALQHQLASDYTSFVAVDSSEITGGSTA
jgi:hypothetical protein